MKQKDGVGRWGEKGEVPRRATSDAAAFVQALGADAAPSISNGRRGHSSLSARVYPAGTLVPFFRFRLNSFVGVFDAPSLFCTVFGHSRERRSSSLLFSVVVEYRCRLKGRPNEIGEEGLLPRGRRYIWVSFLFRFVFLSRRVFLRATGYGWVKAETSWVFFVLSVEIWKRKKAREYRSYADRGLHVICRNGEYFQMLLVSEALDRRL